MAEAQGSPDGLLDAVIAKTDRAGEHVDTLQGEIEAWANRNSYTFWADPKHASREHRIYIGFGEIPDSERWGLLLGDAMHNLRSALDHLVYALAVRVTAKTSPPGWRKLEFPILDRSAYWIGPNDKRLRSLSEDMRASVKSVQPFEESSLEPHKNLLWVLRELDNADKHRTINLVGVLPQHFVACIRTVTSGRMSFTFHTVPLKGEAPVMTITGEAVTEVDDEFEAELMICTDIGTGKPAEVFDLTNKMFDRVSAVVGKFEQFF